MWYKQFQKLYYRAMPFSVSDKPRKLQDKSRYRPQYCRLRRNTTAACCIACLCCGYYRSTLVWRTRCPTSLPAGPICRSNCRFAAIIRHPVCTSKDSPSAFVVVSHVLDLRVENRLACGEWSSRHVAQEGSHWEGAIEVGGMEQRNSEAAKEPCGHERLLARSLLQLKEG